VALPAAIDGHDVRHKLELELEKMTNNAKDYLHAAVAGASPVGLVVLLYERLITDLTRAVAAMEEGDIETRVAEINHAFLILGQLEGSLDSSQAPEAARTQALLYSLTRAKILEAHLKSNRQMLEEQIVLLNDVRAAWEQVDPARNAKAPLPAPLPSAPADLDREEAPVLNASA
jgi:flagellar protein FliS